MADEAQIPEWLSYELWNDGQTLVYKSEFGIIEGAEYTFKRRADSTHGSTWTPVYGQFSTIRDAHTQLELKLLANKTPVTLVARLFDDGLGIRFIVSADAGQALSYQIQYKLSDSNSIYYPIREKESIGPISIKNATQSSHPRRDPHAFSPPILIERSGQSYIALLESDLYSATAFRSIAFTSQGSDMFTSTSS